MTSRYRQDEQFDKVAASGGHEQAQGSREMNVRRHLALLALLAGSIAAAGIRAPPAAARDNLARGAAPVPDFSGVWHHGRLPWFIPPASGPGPVTNLSREKGTGVSDNASLVGDYKNPILQAWAAEVVRKRGELSRAGIINPNPSNTCWPEPVPFLFKNAAIEMLQLPAETVMLFSEDHEVRRARMNEPHPAQVTPSWHGDAVGHYEGDTLVIDTVGVRTDRPHPMIDLFGTPYTGKLHVVERYRLVDLADAKDALARGAKENRRATAEPIFSNYSDKYLRIDFTIEDAGAFTTPWMANMIYQRDRHEEWTEVACAENTFDFFHSEAAQVPRADKPDF